MEAGGTHGIRQPGTPMASHTGLETRETAQRTRGLPVPESGIERDSRVGVLAVSRVIRNSGRRKSTAS